MRAAARCGSFSPPGGEENRRRVLTRDRAAAGALAIISASGAAAQSIRALAARLGVAPAALYRHMRIKQQVLTREGRELLTRLQRPHSYPQAAARKSAYRRSLLPVSRHLGA